MKKTAQHDNRPAPKGKDDRDALAKEALDQARPALAKLPILGPILWLYARDPSRRYLFLADTDWAVLPPVVLDQCRLYTRAELPYAFVSWALVSDAVDARLRGGQSRIAPHEWQSGTHVWLIDVVTPFGQRDETLREVREKIFPDRVVSALLPDPQHPGQYRVAEWPPVSAPDRAH